MYGTFTLTGRHTTPSGHAHAGQVVVTPSAIIRDMAGDVVLSGAEKVTLDVTGAWSIVLPCDSAGLNPSEGIGYKVGYALHATGMPQQSFYATADMAGSTLDVSDIVTVSVPTPLSAIVGPAGPSTPEATAETAGKVRLAGDLAGTADAPTVPALADKVNDTDPRLTDARTPLPHAHATSDVTGLEAELGQKVDVTDERLTDARQPLAHAHPTSQVTGLDTALSGKVDGTDARLSDARTPLPHNHAASEVTGIPAAIDSYISGGGSVAARKGDVLVNVKDYGAKGDGATDDTAAINQAITQNPGRTILIPAGAIGASTYLVNPNASDGTRAGCGILLNQAGTKLLIDQGVTIKAKTSTFDAYAIIRVSAADCLIQGGTIRGDNVDHGATGGEWGHCIDVTAGADRLRIQGVKVTAAWGDGISISGGVSDVCVQDVVADDNRRQGMSIIGAIRPRVVGGVYKNTGLTKNTAPTAGIDIEPNPSSGFDVVDAVLVGVVASGNRGPGIQTVGATGQTLTAAVMGCVATGNGIAGASSPGFYATGSGTNRTRFIGCSARGNSFNGYVVNAPGSEAASCSATGNRFSGFSVTAADVKLTEPVAVENDRSGISTSAGSVNLSIVGGESKANGQLATATYIQVDINGTDTRIVGHVSDAGSLSNKPARGYQIRAVATGTKLFGCSVRGTFTSANIQDDSAAADVMPAVGTAKPAAITSPTADVTALKTAVDAIRAALTSRGITS